MYFGRVWIELVLIPYMFGRIHQWGNLGFSLLGGFWHWFNLSCWLNLLDFLFLFFFSYLWGLWSFIFSWSVGGYCWIYTCIVFNIFFIELSLNSFLRKCLPYTKSKYLFVIFSSENGTPLKKWLTAQLHKCFFSRQL